MRTFARSNLADKAHVILALGIIPMSVIVQMKTVLAFPKAIWLLIEVVGVEYCVPICPLRWIGASESKMGIAFHTDPYTDLTTVSLI